MRMEMEMEMEMEMLVAIWHALHALLRVLLRLPFFMLRMLKMLSPPPLISSSAVNDFPFSTLKPIALPHCHCHYHCRIAQCTNANCLDAADQPHTKYPPSFAIFLFALIRSFALPGITFAIGYLAIACLCLLHKCTSQWTWDFFRVFASNCFLRESVRSWMLMALAAISLIRNYKWGGVMIRFLFSYSYVVEKQPIGRLLFHQYCETSNAQYHKSCIFLSKVEEYETSDDDSGIRRDLASTITAMLSLNRDDTPSVSFNNFLLKIYGSSCSRLKILTRNGVIFCRMRWFRERMQLQRVLLMMICLPTTSSPKSPSKEYYVFLSVKCCEPFQIGARIPGWRFVQAVHRIGLFLSLSAMEVAGEAACGQAHISSLSSAGQRRLRGSLCMSGQSVHSTLFQLCESL